MSIDESCSTSRYLRPLGYSSDDQSTSLSAIYNTNIVSNASSYSYSRFGNDVSTPEIGWDHGEFSPKENRPYMIRWKSGKKVDQRLLMLLESFFQEIYVKRNEFFKKIFPEQYDEYVDVFKKIGAMLLKNNNQTKHHTMQRSLSLGSPRLSETRLDRFKVKTPSVIVVQPNDQGGKSTASTATVSSTASK